MFYRLEYLRSEESPEYFLTKHWTIASQDQSAVVEGKGGGLFTYQPFTLYPYQREFLRLTQEHDNLNILKGRQIGFTEIIAGWMAHAALFSPGTPCFYASHRAQDAEKVSEAIREVGCARLSSHLIDAGLPVITNKLDDRLKFSNGSSIEIAVVGKGNPARSQTAAILVLDEFAFYDYQSRSLRSAESTTLRGGKRVISSTSKGMGNVFARLWLKEDSGYKSLFYGWQVVPGRAKNFQHEQLKSATNQAERAEVIREHPGSAQDAFMNVGRNVFDRDKIADQRPEIDNAVGQIGDLVEEAGILHFVPDALGPLTVFDRGRGAESRASAAVIGADVAMGLEHGDYSAAHVLGIDGRVLAVYRAKPDSYQFGEFLDRLGRWYGGCLIGVEAQGPGQTVLGKLMELGYPKIYRREKAQAAVGASALPTLGWHTSVQSKFQLTDAITEGLSSGWLRVMCAMTADELESFERVGKVQMEGKPFDDLVMSLGIAMMMIRYASDTAAAHDASIVKYSAEWWEKVAEYKKESHQRAGGRRRGFRRTVGL